MTGQAGGFQDFTVTARPEQGPPRLAALREALAREGLDGFIVPRADAHQGEYVAPCDDRLAWLTGFTGSAGMCIVLPDVAGLFVDGRYRVQAPAQVDTDHFTPLDWPATRPGDWLRKVAPDGAVIGIDPWLHTHDEIAKLEKSLEGSSITLRHERNMVDAIWPDQPPRPNGAIFIHSIELAGEPATEKRRRLAEELRAAGQTAAVLTLPDSLCWLLNIRGADVPRNPVVQAFAILFDDARVSLFVDPARVDAALSAHMGEGVTLRPPDAFEAALRTLPGPVRTDPASAPLAVSGILSEAGSEIAWARDPCILPKARKNAAEIAGTTEAHLRDGAALCAFLCWLDARIEEICAGSGALSEIEVVRALEGFRRATGALHDISFETIAGSGPHGAIVHYRVSEESNRSLAPGRVAAGGLGRSVPRRHHRCHPHRGRRPARRRGARGLHPRAQGHDRHIAPALATGACRARPRRAGALSALAGRAGLRPRDRPWRRRISVGA
jgi:Xaa-Pro aminopeptidase